MHGSFERGLLSAESSQIGEQRFGAGKRQQNAAQRFPAFGLVADEILPCKVWRECLQDGMIVMHQVLSHPVNILSNSGIQGEGHKCQRRD